MKIRNLATAAFVLALSCIAINSARADLIWYEGFQYPDGSLTNSGVWIKNSGSATPTSDMLVNNSNLEVSATGGSLSRQDDCYRLLATVAGSPYTNAPQVLYASFTVICTNLPNGGGSYFTTFYNTGAGYFGRVQAFTNGSVLPNTWRLGVTANALASNPANGGYPVDLALNTPYQVVLELDPITLQAGTIWVNPIDVNQSGVAPTETHYTSSDSMGAALTSAVNGYQFRQASSFGSSFFLITNLAVATTFAEAATNVWSATPEPPTIVYQPVGVTNFVGASITLSAVANGQGLGNMTFQWQQNGADYFGGNGGISSVLTIPNAQASDSGDFRLIATTPHGLSVTSSVAPVSISVAQVPPSFETEPASTTVYTGQSVIFSTLVVSPGNVFYQWKSNGVDIVGATAPDLELDNVTTNFAASYSVGVTNDVVANGIVSSNAVLTVLNPPQVSIAYLRTLVDPTTYRATNVPPTIPYEVTGVVTTYTNITTGDTASYYLQDATAGINIFVTGGSTFRPQLGDVVDFIGVLSSYTTGLELYADATAGSSYPYTSFSILSNNIAGLPQPESIPYTILNDESNANYNLGGKLVQISDVHFGDRAGTETSTNANDTVTVTNSLGQTFYLFFPYVDLDVAGQNLPDYASTVSGVLYSANYSVTNMLVVTRYADINTNVVVMPIALNVEYTGGNLVLTWSDASFSLQSSTNVAGPYTTIGGAMSPHLVAPTDEQSFFRLIH